MILPIALLFQAACLWTVCVAKNVTVDDQDPLFKYSGGGSWRRIAGSNDTMDEDGGHMLTVSSDASANITFTFASVYFLSALWPYRVTTDYSIDGSSPINVDMQDHSVPAVNGGSATKAARVVGQWNSNANQQHTIFITVPPGQDFAVVDMFIFDVLDPSDTSSSVTTSTRTSSSSSSSTSSSSTAPPSASTAGSHTQLSTQVRDLVISMAVLGTLLALLFIFLLWWFCVRRENKDPNSGNTGPNYHPVPTAVITPFTGHSGHYGQQSLNTFGHHASSPSQSSLPSSFYTNQAASLPPQIRPPIAPLLAKQISHSPQGHRYTPSMISDSPPMYDRVSTSPDSHVLLIGRTDATPASITPQSSFNTNVDEKSRSYSPSSRRLPNTQFSGSPEPEDSVVSSAIVPGRTEPKPGNSAWDSGYPQPLRFIPIG